MKAAFRTLLGLAIVVAAVMVVRAEDDKKKDDKDAKKTLKGEIGCPKCVFGIEKKCGNAIKVKEGDKDVIYVFLDMRNKEKYHKKICTDSHKGSVTGKISKKDKQNYITPEKDSVKFDD
jgi:hypothetical protein